MIYLILMTTAGAMLMIGYLLWERLLRRFVTESMKYCALICILLVYAVPWVWLKRVYGYILRWPMQMNEAASGGTLVGMADIVTKGQAYMTPDYWWEQMVFFVWMIVALVLAFRRIVLYVHSRRRLLAVTERCKDSFLAETLERLREEFHLKRRVDIFVTPGRNATLTIGLLRPVILLQKNYARDELYVILKHEMIHVVRRDLLLKQLLGFVCCLHWFNPFVYTLKNRFNRVCESSCDERVNGSSSKDERNAYSRVLVVNLPRGGEPSGRESENAYFDAKERVNLIMGVKQVKRWKKRLAAGVFAALIMVNSFTAMAYPDVYHVDVDYADVAMEASDGSAVWADEYLEDIYYEPMIEVFYEEAFIDEEGNVYPVNSFTPYVFCIKHDIRSGYFQTHKKQDDGGCTVKVYEGTRCTICNSIWVGDLYATLTYVKCPH